MTLYSLCYVFATFLSSERSWCFLSPSVTIAMFAFVSTALEWLLDRLRCICIYTCGPLLLLLQ